MLVIVHEQTNKFIFIVYALLEELFIQSHGHGFAYRCAQFRLSCRVDVNRTDPSRSIFLLSTEFMIIIFCSISINSSYAINVLRRVLVQKAWP